MKKLLGVLFVSLAILAGLIGYVKYTGLDEELLEAGNEIITPQIIPVATPSPKPMSPEKLTDKRSRLHLHNTSHRQPELHSMRVSHRCQQYPLQVYTVFQVC